MYETAYNPKFVPEKSPKVSVKTTTAGKKTSHMMRNYATKQYYDLDDNSKLIWDLVDGKRTVREIIREAELESKLKDPDLVTGTLLFFAESGALLSKEAEAQRKRVRVVSSFETQVTLVWDGTRIFKAIERILRPILRGPLFWFSMILVVVGVVLFIPRFNSTFDNAYSFQILGSSVVGFLFYQMIVLAPVIAIHELSHGLALVHYGGRAGEIGTGVFYFGPMFYVDAADGWSLTKRQRMMIMWAGNLSTILIGAGIVLGGLFVQYPKPLDTYLYITAFWCFYSTLWNLAPPFETDGYYILADILNMPNLRSDGFSYLKSLLTKLFGGPSKEPPGMTNRTRLLLLGYAVFSISFVAYIVYLTARFTIYMARDASFWAGQLGTSTVSGVPLTALAYAVGLTSIGYFAMMLTGYSVVVQKQVSKSLVRSLKFEAIHDRDLSMFFYIPKLVSSSKLDHFHRRLRSIGGKITPKSTVEKEGPLSSVTLRMGSTSLPLQQIGPHLRGIEDKFSRAYENFLGSELRSLVLDLVSIPGTEKSTLDRMLQSMARKTVPGERRLAVGQLQENLARQNKDLWYLMTSTFSSAWTIELPPALESDFKDTVLSTLLLGDLTMTNLVDELEEFKKRIVYGFDSIAELAVKQSAVLDEASDSPEKFQLLAFFQPVKGRLIFVGRTQRIEHSLDKLGPMFALHVWSGYVDNMLREVNLDLYTIGQSLPPLPADPNSLRDGEVKVLFEYASNLERFEPVVMSILLRTQSIPSRYRLKQKELKMVFQPQGEKIGMLDSVLALNHENLEAVPRLLKEASANAKVVFKWVRTVREALGKELDKRKATVLKRKNGLIRKHLVAALFSGVLVLSALAFSEQWIATSFLAAAVIIQAIFFALQYLFWQSSYDVSRYPSLEFNKQLLPTYALGQTLRRLVIGIQALDVEDLLDVGKDEKNGEGLPTETLTSRRET